MMYQHDSIIYNPDQESSLAVKAYNDLKTLIIYDKIKQGAATSISALSKELNLSRTPVTAACQRLEYEGFINIIPKQGIIVKSISLPEAKDIYEMRAMLESYIMRRYFKEYSEHDIALLEASVERQEHIMDGLEFMNEDRVFHELIIGKCTNNHILANYSVLYDLTFSMGIQNCKSPSRISSNVSDHKKIVESIKSGSMENSVYQVENHILTCLASLLNIYMPSMHNN